jgi:peptidyl-prolyl cis-trans isomerase A (cyclophilin A)
VTETIGILIETDFGSITLELYPDLAPLTVANFLQYVDENRYDGGCFYRVVHMDNQPNNDVKIEVIQGGLKADQNEHSLPSILHESTNQTRILHTNGVISMARNEPGSASSEFFICLGSQPELDYAGRRNPDGQGFAAFGQVMAGMDVVQRIQYQPEHDQYLIQDVTIRVIQRLKAK